MSIVIDADLTSLMNRLHISQSKMLEEYASMSIEEIVEAEAEAGNQLAVNYAKELFNSPGMLAKIFKLADSQNKLELLREMSTDQLQDFLPLMEEEDIDQGFFFFDMNKLLKMLEEIPSDQLVRVVFEMFSEDEVIQYLPEDELNDFLESTDLDKTQIMKHLQGIPQAYLAQMYEAVSGQDAQKLSSSDLSDRIEGFNPLQFQDALNSMQLYAKQQLTLGIASEHKELYENFDPHAYTNMINTYKFQPEVAQSMSAVEPDEKIKMMKELPKDLLSIVITQMDAEDFAEQLIKKTPDLIGKIIMQ